MDCLSLSYKNADVELREKLVFTNEKTAEIYGRLCTLGIAKECVMLCTCNRTELYYSGKENAEDEIINILSEIANLESGKLKKYILCFSDDKAISHLFKVASGIESMVIGEDEILGQTKKAYFAACDAGTVSYELNMIFQAAITCAKKIKTETKLSKSSVSVATLAAAEAAKNHRNILVIGANGKTGSTVVKNLVSYKNVSVKAAMRKYHIHGVSFPKNAVEIVDYGNRYEYIKNADCIISATASPHYTITLYDMKQYIHDDKSRLFIDLAVPPDIDPAVTESGNTKLINIDYFEELARQNNEIKLSSVNEAEEIIRTETDKLKRELLFHDFLPQLDTVKEEMQQKPFEDLLYKMKSEADSSAFLQFINVLKEMTGG